MAKFLSYEDRLEIESGLKENLTFTEIGKKLRGGQNYYYKIWFLYIKIILLPEIIPWKAREKRESHNNCGISGSKIEVDFKM